MKKLEEKMVINSSYYYGESVDRFGDVRKFVLCAVLCNNPLGNYVDNFAYSLEPDYILRLGLSITNPVDDYNQLDGERRAFGRALSNNRAISELYSLNKEEFNSFVIKALLNTKAEDIKLHPNKYIKSLDTKYKKEYDLHNALNEAYVKKANIEDDIKKINKELEKFVYNDEVEGELLEIVEENEGEILVNKK